MKKLFTFICIAALTVAKSQTPSLNWVNGLTGGNGKACSVKTDNSGNIYIAGNFMGTIDFDPSASTATLQAFGNSDIYLAKYDINGNYIWAKLIGGTSALDYAKCIALDNSGNIYMTGSTDGNSDFDPSASVATLSTSVQQMYFAKYDNNGNYVFAKILQASGGNEGLGITVDNAGNIYITGNKTGQTDFDPSGNTVYLNNIGNSDTYLAKYDNLGNYQWAMNLGSNLNDYGYSITCDANNDILIAGEFRNVINFDPIGGSSTGTLVSNNQGDGFVAKYLSNGNLVWAQKIGGTSVRNIALDGQNNIFICGEYRNGGDFDPSASTFSISESGNGGSFVAKYDNNCSFNWAKGFTGPSSEVATSLATDASGNVYAGGQFFGTSDFDPTAGTNTLTSNGSNDFFIVGLNGSGNMLFVTTHGGTNGDNSNSLAVYGSNLINLGDFSQTVDFDPAVTTNTLFTFGTSAAYIQNLSIAGFVSGIHESANEITLSVSPNPASNHITLKHSLNNSINLTITDQSGRVVANYNNVASGDQIPINLSEGLYFCSVVQNGTTLKTNKLIIQ